LYPLISQVLNFEVMMDFNLVNKLLCEYRMFHGSLVLLDSLALIKTARKTLEELLDLKSFSTRN